MKKSILISIIALLALIYVTTLDRRYINNEYYENPPEYTNNSYYCMADSKEEANMIADEVNATLTSYSDGVAVMKMSGNISNSYTNI